MGLLVNWRKSMQLEHMSFSALSRYEECPRSFYLGKIKHAEEKQT